MVRNKSLYAILLILAGIGGLLWAGSYFVHIPYCFQRSTQQSSISMSIGIVDINRIKTDSKVFQRFKEVLDSVNDTIHKEILEKETRLRTEFEEFKKREEEAKSPTPELVKQKAELDKKHAELEKTARARREELINNYTRGLQKIKLTIQEIMDELGRSYDLKLILNKSFGEGNKMDQSIVLFCSNGLDLTDEVIQRLDNHPSLKDMRIQESGR